MLFRSRKVPPRRPAPRAAAEGPEPRPPRVQQPGPTGPRAGRAWTGSSRRHAQGHWRPRRGPPGGSLPLSSRWGLSPLSQEECRSIGFAGLLQQDGHAWIVHVASPLKFPRHACLRLMGKMTCRGVSHEVRASPRTREAPRGRQGCSRASAQRPGSSEHAAALAGENVVTLARARVCAGLAVSGESPLLSVLSCWRVWGAEDPALPTSTWFLGLGPSSKKSQRRGSSEQPDPRGAWVQGLGLKGESLDSKACGRPGAAVTGHRQLGT